MSEPNWVPLGVRGGIIDYVGGWSAATPYKPGDVVVYNGIQYLAVNPSTNQAPPSAALAPTIVPLVTSLPASPYDGQEVILVDSLVAAPGYHWLCRYCAAIPDAYKWIVVGPPWENIADAAGAAINSRTQVGATGYYYEQGASFIIPRAGIYAVSGYSYIDHNGDGNAVSFSPFAGTAVTGYAYNAYIAGATGTAIPFAFVSQLLTVAAASTRIGYAVSTAGAATKKFRLQSILILPKRLA